MPYHKLKNDGGFQYCQKGAAPKGEVVFIEPYPPYYLQMIVTRCRLLKYGWYEITVKGGIDK